MWDSIFLELALELIKNKKRICHLCHCWFILSVVFSKTFLGLSDRKSYIVLIIKCKSLPDQSYMSFYICESIQPIPTYRFYQIYDNGIT